MDWLLEGEWFKNCNCDPGCPCDFNQAPTHPNCEGMVAMRITSGQPFDAQPRWAPDGKRFAFMHYED